MERRYLAATLALAATFAIFSREFRAGCLAKLPHSRAEVVADIACAKHYVVEQLMAKLEPYVDRSGPEEAQMVAELNLPELVRVEQKAAEVQAQTAQRLAHQKCEAAMRTQLAKQQVFHMRVIMPDQAQQFSDLAVVRAEDLSERAQEWSNLATERAQRINVDAMIRAQEITARAMERAQREMEKSRRKMGHSQSQSMPIHINFVAPMQMDFAIEVPAPAEPPSPTIF